MGDRANIVIKQPESIDRIYLYTHWSGSELPEIVREALNSPEGRARWSDHAYLTRVLFCTLTREAEANNQRETGYGISTAPPDNDGYPFIVIDVEAQTITFEHAKNGTAVGQSFTFDQYARQPSEMSWPKGVL